MINLYEEINTINEVATAMQKLAAVEKLSGEVEELGNRVICKSFENILEYSKKKDKS